jgi:integrase
MSERTQKGSIVQRALASGAIVHDAYFRDQDGKLISRRGFKSQGLAQGYLDEHLIQVRRRTFAPVEPVTVGEYVSRWVESRQIKPSSLGAYRSMGKKVTAVLGDKRVSDLKPSDVNALLSAYRTQKRKTKANLLIFTKTLLADAVEDGHAATNPSKSRAIQKPRVVDEDDTGQVTLEDIMQPDEIGRVLDAAEESHRPLFHLLASSGCRLGEALSLQWQDVDLLGGVLHVRRTAFKGQTYAPKSKAAIRGVDLGDQCVAMLSALKRGCYGETTPPDGALIFPGRGGKIQDPASLRRGAWARALRKAGLPHRKIHSLRHSFVSLLHARGEDVAYIAQQIGHSSPVITLTTYTKVLKPRRRHAASGVEALLRANVRANTDPRIEQDGSGQDSAMLVKCQTEQNGAGRTEEAKYFKAE